MTGHRSLLGRRCVVVGGAGAVGAMFVDLLLGAGASVCVVDTAAPDGDGPPVAFQRGDIMALEPPLTAELGRADVVVLAVPEGVALAALERLAGALRPGTLLVDTLSVKGPIVAATRAHANGLEALSLNPMFAPSLGIDGHVIAAVVVNDGPRAQGLLELLERRGGRIAVVGADEHDVIAATTQALTHATVLAFGLALAELDVDVGALSPMAPPPHRTLLALLARIASGAPETYRDVQTGNEHAGRARAALAGGLRRLADVVDGGDAEDFAAVLAELRDVLGTELDDYADICAQLFEAGVLATGRPGSVASSRGPHAPGGGSQ